MKHIIDTVGNILFTIVILIMLFIMCFIAVNYYVYKEIQKDYAEREGHYEVTFKDYLNSKLD